MFNIITPLWLMNLGSFCLGVTLAIVVLCIWGTRSTTISGAESCLISLIGMIGFSLSTLFFTAATLL